MVGRSERVVGFARGITVLFVLVSAGVENKRLLLIKQRKDPITADDET